MTHLTATPLNDIPWVTHGFFTRYDETGRSLDVAFHDDNDNAAQNRERILSTLSIDTFVTARQAHSAKALPVRGSWTSDTPEADALVTKTPNVAVGVLTADCVPVLFASTQDKIVAAAHAGWKGALTGVLQNTIKLMTDQGAKPSDIVAVIGPCISGISYEVSEGFQTPFIEQSADNMRFFMPATRDGHLFFDLPAYAVEMMRAAGVEKISHLGEDTLPQRDRFFSYRRSCLTDDTASRFGRQASVIGIKDGV